MIFLQSSRISEATISRQFAMPMASLFLVDALPL